MAEDRERDPEGGARADAGGMSEAELDDNLEGTFPASDPPSWTLGTDHREGPAGRRGGPEDRPGGPPPPRRDTDADDEAPPRDTLL